MILAMAFGAAVFMENAWWGILGGTLLFLALWSFYLPQRYRLDEDRIVKKSLFGTESRPWKEVRSICPDRWGVLLSPFPYPTRLAKFRGISVQFSPDNRKEVLEFIRSRIGGKSGPDSEEPG